MTLITNRHFFQYRNKQINQMEENSAPNCINRRTGDIKKIMILTQNDMFLNIGMDEGDNFTDNII